MRNINIVLDIDGMLALNEGANIQKHLPKEALKLLEDSFIDVCFKYEGTKHSYLHYLLPGCFEFIKAILDITNVELIFFSSGVKPRNIVLVEKIMDKIARSDSKYSAKKVTIFSKEHCINTEKYRNHIDANAVFQPKGNGMFGNYKKDLRLISRGEEKYNELREKAFHDPKILAPNSEKDQTMLNNIVLIDDDYSFVYNAQEKNLLKVQWCTANALSGFKKIGLDDAKKLEEWTKINAFKGINHLFYATGMLFKALEIVNGDYEKITDVLWGLQTNGCKTENCDQQGLRDIPDYNVIAEDASYYIKGMDILRKYNPTLEFILTDRW
jgi:hypothetical protein